jgi:uncharacterized protein YggE
VKKLLLALPVFLLAVAAISAACGGDDTTGAPQTGQITTQKGLLVAAIGANSSARNGDTTGGTTTDLNAAAPAPAAVDSQTAAKLAMSGQAGNSVAGARPADVAGAPALQADGSGITVQGYGSATANADSAIVEFYFSRGAIGKPVPLPYSDGSSGSGTVAPDQPVTPPAPGTVTPITEADLQPVIDAITGQGVARSDIQFVNQSYYDAYNASATLRVTVKNVSSVDGVVQAATSAASGLSDISMNGSNVSYTVSDCTALEKEATKAAVDDARSRGAIFAEALGVGLGNITGASDYSYTPYGGTPCSGGFYGPYPMYGGVAYTPGQPSQVQVFANISVTFAIS